jgi:hypothetical protein
MPLSIPKRQQYVLKAGLVLALLPFFALSYYNQPYSDDYDMGWLFRAHGFSRAYQDFYLQWSGRFFTNALFLGANPVSYDWLGGMFLPVIVGLVCKIGLLSLVLRRVSQQQLSKSLCAWLAGGLTLLYLSIVPDAYSATYYFTDIIVYQVPALLLLLVPLAIDQAQRATPASRSYWRLLALIGTLAVAGSNEMTIALLGWLLLAGFAISVYRKQAHSAYIWFGLGIVLLVAGGLALYAPGNQVRLQVNATPATSLSQVSSRLLKGLKLVLQSFSLHLGLLLPLLGTRLGVRLLPSRPSGLAIPLPISAAFLLLGVGLGSLPYALVWDTPLPPRAINVLLWWLLLGWLVACWASVSPATQPLGRSARLLIAGMLLLLVGLTSLRVWQECLREAPRYAAQWQARYELFRQAARRPHTKLTITPMLAVTPHHIMIQGYDLQPDYDFYTNRQLARWFGLDSVRTDPAQMKRAAF